MPDDDNDIHAALRELVDEGGPAASDVALHEVMRRGRRKRTHKRLGAVVAVVVAVTGIGVAAATVPTLLAEPGPIVPASPSVQETPVPPTTGNQQIEPPETTTPSDPMPEQPKTKLPATSATEPQFSCPDTPTQLLESDEFPLPQGVQLATFPQGQIDTYLTRFEEAVQAALPNAAFPKAELDRPYYLGILEISGPGFSGTMRSIARCYYGDPRPNRDIHPGEPLIVYPENPATNQPVALIYFADGRLYIVYWHSPEPLPARQLRMVGQELATVGR